MLSPSDFNNAVPQFTNGNYASNPINPQYIAEPDAESYNRGTEPLQTLPAQWWNWFINKFTARFNKVNIYVKNIFNELAQVLSIFNITPDGTEQTPTTSQLKTVFETCYPQYVKTVTTGTAVGCIPTVGTALGTTDGQFLATDACGNLKPSGYTASSFRASDWTPTCVQCAGTADGINFIPNYYNGDYYIPFIDQNGPNLYRGCVNNVCFNPVTNTLSATGMRSNNFNSYNSTYNAWLYMLSDTQNYTENSMTHNFASIGVTNGNLHLDARQTDNNIPYGIYLNFYSGSDGVLFGNGHGTTVAHIDCDGAACFTSVKAKLVMEPNLWTACTGVWYCGEKVAYTNFCNPTDNYILAIYTPYKYPDKFYYCGSGVLLIPPHGLIEPPDGLSVTQTGDGIRLF